MVEQLKELQKEANKIFESDVSWELKYDLIFSPKISDAIFELIDLDYYDPDTTYKEDVTAFINAVNDKFQNLDTI